MKKKSKRFLIATETREVCVIRGEFGNASAICAECSMEVEYVNVDSAVDLSSVRALEIFRLAATGEIHSLETESGHLLLCLNSLRQLREKGI